MILGKYSKAPLDNKRYTVDYSEWLDAAELVSIATSSIPVNTTIPPLAVNTPQIAVNGLSIQYYVSGGVVGTDYEILIVITTNQGQVREDTVIISVREP